MQKDSKEINPVSNKEVSLCEYRCAHCGKIVARHSDKHWIKSYCEETGKITRLILTNR